MCDCDCICSVFAACDTLCLSDRLCVACVALSLFVSFRCVLTQLDEKERCAPLIYRDFLSIWFSFSSILLVAASQCIHTRLYNQ